MKSIVRLFVSALAITSSVACDADGSRAFTSGRAENECQESIPACAETYANCELDDSQYASVRFPGQLQFLVSSRAEDTIRVEFFISSVLDVGQQTIIYWNEPGCSDLYLWDSAGEDFVSASRSTNIFSRDQQVHEPGDHLVQVFSDMNGDVLLGVHVVEQGTED